MNHIKSENGFTGVDIAISVLIITIFITVIGNLIMDINLNSKSIERETTATSYAIQTIENIKGLGIERYTGQGITEPFIEEEDIYIDNEFTGYHKKITTEDYVYLKNDSNKQADILKKVTVEISYKVANKDKNVTISTCISKE